MGWIAAAIGAAGALGGGALGAQGAQNASSAQRRSAEQNLAFQRWLYEQNIRQNEPWRATGQGALNQLAQLYGIPYMPYQSPNLGAPGASYGANAFSNPRAEKGKRLRAGQIIKMLKRGMSVDDITNFGYLGGELRPDRINRLMKHGASAEGIAQLQAGPLGARAGAQPGMADLVTPSGPDMSIFQASPDYQFRRDEGMRDLENSAAARGGAFSGNALRGLAGFNSGLASQEFGNFINRRENLAGLGQSATGQAGQYGMNFGNQGGNAMQNIGDARASGVANSANMWGQGLMGAANAFGNYFGNRAYNSQAIPPTYDWGAYGGAYTNPYETG